jgi:hypothetical protein
MEREREWAEKQRLVCVCVLCVGLVYVVLLNSWAIYFRHVLQFETKERQTS